MDLQQFLLQRDTPTYNAYYNGKMSYALHGKAWAKYVDDAFPDLQNQHTSENIFKDVLDLYVQNLIPMPKELKGFSNVLIPLLSRGECPVVVDSSGTPHFPEHFEMLSDGLFTVAVIFTRSLEKMRDYATFVWSDGRSEVWEKELPKDMSPPNREGYAKVEGGDSTGNTLLRLSLDDKGFGAALAALQDRVNHSILDQTVIAEMYARPFWYLLNVDIPPHNPYLPASAQGNNELLKEQKGDSAGRVFTSSSEGPFGQLTPPTISDMIGYHDSMISKVSQSTGIPEFFFKPGSGQTPSGVALKVLSRRFNNKIARMRDNIEGQLEELIDLLEIKPAEGDTEVRLWPASDDLLQDALDSHGMSLVSMGYPLGYVAEVVTPGVDLNDYMDDGFEESQQDAVSKLAAQVYSATQGGVVLKTEESRRMLREAGAPLDADDDLTGDAPVVPVAVPLEQPVVGTLEDTV